jgi:hypothetical protein
MQLSSSIAARQKPAEDRAAANSYCLVTEQLTLDDFLDPNPYPVTR